MDRLSKYACLDSHYGMAYLTVSLEFYNTFMEHVLWVDTNYIGVQFTHTASSSEEEHGKYHVRGGAMRGGNHEGCGP